MSRALILGFVLVITFTAASGQTDADKEAIKRTALNYAEGWYEGTPIKWRVR